MTDTLTGTPTDTPTDTPAGTSADEDAPVPFVVSDTEDLGHIGNRSLVAVQTFEIGRLTSDPVPIIPSTFVAVTGRGPRGDSNGSGKTTFLSAVSLLAGDPQWKLAGGGQAAAGLLFEPSKGGTTAEQYDSAGRGYIVGLFAETDGGDPITVWMRINTSSPYLRVRWADGVHLVQGDTDRERHHTADDVWAKLDGSSELGPARFAAHLYGENPRCLAWVHERGTKRSGPSLLKMDAGAFTPAEVGRELITLSGRAGLLDEDLDQRRKLAAAAERLTEAEANHQRALAAEEHELRSVDARTAARRQLAEARADWDVHWALGLVESADRNAELESRIADLDAAIADADAAHVDALAQVARLDDPAQLHNAEADARSVRDAARGRLAEADAAQQRVRGRLAELAAQRDQLRTDAAAADGITVDQAAQRLAETEAGLTATQRTAGQRSQAAEEAARAAELAAAGLGGEAGPTLNRLAAAGVDAVSLTDTVTIAEGSQSLWEPLLWPWRAAVVVSPAEHAAAVSAAHPGDIIITSDTSGPAPAGVSDTHPNAATFLQALADGTPTQATVVGGFTDPVAGRLGLARSALEAAETAAAAAAEAEDAVEAAQAARDEAASVHAAARAAARLTKVEAAISEAETQAAAATADLQSLTTAADQTEEQFLAVYGELAGWESERRRVEAARDHAASRLADMNQRRLAALSERHSTSLTYWAAGWGRSEAEARTLASTDDRSAEAARSAANRALTDTLVTLGVRSDGEGAPTVELTAAIEDRSDAARTRDPDTAVAAFTRVCDELDRWLGLHAATDGRRVEEITTERDRRSTALDHAASEHASATRLLSEMHATIEATIRARLDAISESLARLEENHGGYGADLQISVTRPAAPDDQWIWDVTPRYRRAPGGPLVSYQVSANTGQEKLFSLHLVLGALGAAGAAHGQILILDELGDSLGAEHRNLVLDALGAITTETGLTVLATCQDDILPAAKRVYSELLYLERPSGADLLNSPTRAQSDATHPGIANLTAHLFAPTSAT